MYLSATLELPLTNNYHASYSYLNYKEPRFVAEGLPSVAVDTVKEVW